TGNEAEALRDWVGRGGRLVLIDRRVNEELAPKSEGWSIKSREWFVPTFNYNPGDSQQMTEGVTALHPSQPTLLTKAIDTVMPSRFAGRLSILPPLKDNTAETSGAERLFEDPGLRRDELKAETSAAPIVHVGN